MKLHRYPLRLLRTVPVLVVCMLSAFFAAAPSRPGAQTPPDVTFTLNQSVDFVTGQKGVLKDTPIGVELLEARGPRAGCADCPSRATLRVRSGSEVSDLHYQLSGNMPPELLAKARRQSAFDYVFVAVRISDKGFTLNVSRATKSPGEK
jgi:hypothetical protein